MIPKIIHYCWFGHNPLPPLAEKCIKGWKKRCPDYEFMEWNEDTFDLASAPLYVRQAYDAKKWAFVTDYIRLHVVYEHGGIYLDTDVELIRSPNALLKYSAFFGFEDDTYVNTGLGFGAEKSTPVLYEMMADYQDIPFILEDGEMDLLPCPVRNTTVLSKRGLKQDGTKQLLDDGILVLCTEYLCPFDNISGLMNKTRNTISIHHYNASWVDEHTRNQVRAHRKIVRAWKRKDNIIHLPNRIAMKLLGKDRYEKMKLFLKGARR